LASYFCGRFGFAFWFCLHDRRSRSASWSLAIGWAWGWSLAIGSARGERYTGGEGQLRPKK